MNVMVVAPHPDDESIGCGGSICNHVAGGDPVTVAYLSSGERGLAHLAPEEAVRVREAEAEAAASVLGLSGTEFLRLPDSLLGSCVDEAAARLAGVVEESRPELLYLPHPQESHPDHAASLPVVWRALEEVNMTSVTLLTYEVWTPLPVWDLVNDITSVMSRKLEAIRCYPSQLRQFRYDDAACGLNTFRGALSGACRYAEAFRYEWSCGGG